MHKTEQKLYIIELPGNCILHDTLMKTCISNPSNWKEIQLVKILNNSKSEMASFKIGKMLRNKKVHSIVRFSYFPQLHPLSLKL